MADWKDFANIWKTVGEVDLRPIREDAVRELKIAMVGEEGSGRHALAEQMRRDPARPAVRTHTPVNILELDGEEGLKEADLIVVLAGVVGGDFTRHQALVRRLTNAGKKVLVFYNHDASETAPPPSGLELAWEAASLVVGPVDNPRFLLKEFVPAVLELLPGHHLPLARLFPLFRMAVAHRLINDTCFSNAAYALSTSLAELVPVLNIPFNIADMVVLTKAQAFLMYKLGLALGYSTRWQDYVKEFGGVIGSGFVWRQVARYLVGLIPVVGIIPKVGVAYSGTFVVGQAVLGWYLTGRHISPRRIRELTRQAYWQGRAFALDRLAKAPRLRLPRRKRAELPAQLSTQTCPNCARNNAADALFCQYCGQALLQSSEEAH